MRINEISKVGADLTVPAQKPHRLTWGKVDKFRLLRSELAEAVHEESFEDYVTRLENMGIKTVGNGINSVVFQHPTLSHVVAKVFIDADKGYRDFLEFCIKNPNNKYVPRVFETDDFSDERRTKYFTKELHATTENYPYSIAFLEKLAPVTNGAMDEMVKLCDSLSGKSIDRLSQLGFAGWAAIAKNEKSGDLQSVAKFLIDQISKGYLLDLGNRKNFCLRGNQFVFIDPLA